MSFVPSPVALLKKSLIDPKRSVAWLIVILTVSVFIAEAAVMLLINMLPDMPKLLSIFLDSAILSALLFPAFYYLVFRPLLQGIAELKRAKEELRATAVTFEIKDPILITDADANIIRANKRFLAITGYELEELIGKNPRIFQTGRNSANFYDAMWQQLARKDSWSGATSIRSKTGNDNLCWLTITAVKNEQQEITHYVGIYNNG
jgi:PAS domain S-box-containing protein